jgi:hypothetical protein
VGLRGAVSATYLKRRVLALVWGTLACYDASAAPMGFQDSWMSMGDISANWRELYANYAVSATDAFGVDNTYMRSDNKALTLELSELTYTRLVKRWNLPDAQANFWFVTGIGQAWTRDRTTGMSETRAMISPGIQFDYETTRIYFAAMSRFYRASGINHDFDAVRGGFSFYETEYDETQPWFVLEARRMHDLSQKVEVTPMLRLVNRSYFVEAGINNSGRPRFNFMYIF